MANLTDTSVNGDLRVTGTMFGTQAGNYATCATAAATAAKAVTISGFTLTTGIHVYVKFNEANSAAVGSLTLNVSGTGAKPIKCRASENLGTAGSLAANGIYEFVYDGTNWVMVGSAVTGVKGANESTYRWGNVSITAENVGAAASSHSHGNIANGGTLTDTAAAAAGNDYVVIRDADNAKIQTSTIKGTDVADAVTKKHSHSTLTLSTTAQAYDGSHTLALPSSDPYTSARTPTSHASSATTYGVGTASNYGHVKLDNSTPLTVGTTSSDGVATGKAHVHNALESVARESVTTADLAHINTNTRAHMILSQISNSTSTTHDPGDGYVLSFMWDNTGKYDAQLFIPDVGNSTNNAFGRLKVRYCNNSAWGDWGFLPAAQTATLLTSSDNLNNLKGDGFGNILGYCWESTSTPSNTAFSDNHGAELLVFGTSGTDYCTQVELRSGRGIYQRRLVGGTWGNWEKMLVSSDIATGSANGTISVAGTDVAVKGLGGAAYLNTGTASGTVATGNHTHGNITNGGALQTNDITIASGDKLVVTDSSDSSKVARTSVSFDGSTTTTALTPKGTFEAFAKAADITSAIQALDVSSQGGDGKYIKSISEADGKISATAETMDTAPTASSTKAVTSGGVKTALDEKVTKISLGALSNTANYTMFIRMPLVNAEGNNNATILLTQAGSYGGTLLGNWLINVSNRGSSASAPKPSMEVRRLVPYNGNAPVFGYYVDTTNSYIYFGMYRPAYSGSSYVNVLGNVGATIQDFGDSTTQPTGWAPVDEITFNDGIEFIVGTWTATSGTWTGVSKEQVLVDGKQILLYLPYAGSGNATLNLTLANGNTTGAKSCYWSGTSRLTTHYGQYQIARLVYKKALTINGNTYEGWWASDRDTNSTYSGMVDAYLNNAADAAKSASSTNFKLTSGVTIMLANNAANTKNAALTLNVNGTGAKTLYINGSASSASNYTIPVGTFPCYYDGTNWYLWTDGTFQVSQLRYRAMLGEHQATMRYHIQVNNTGSNPKGWCSILRVTKTSGYGSYDALRVHGMLYDGNGNWEYQQERRIEFQAIVNISHNTANLYLGKTTLTADNWIRLVKVADRDYELQYNAATANYDLDVYYQYEGNASAYVTRYTTYTATTVSGTAITSEKLLPGSIAYRADADGDGNNIKATYFKSSGNVTLVSGSATTIGTQNGTDVKLTLPTIPAAAKNGALKLGLNGGTASSIFTADQSGDSTLTFASGASNGNIAVNGTDVTVYTHPTSGANVSKGDTTNQTPGFGSTFKVTSGTVDNLGHTTTFAEHTVKIPNATATSSAAGLMSADDYKRLNGSKDIGEHDADLCTANGFYYASSHMPSSTLGWTEREAGSDGALFVQAHTTSWVGQIAQDYRNGNLFIRGKNNGTFGEWKRIPYLTVKNKGGTTTPVYVDANGEIQACTAYSSATVGTATNSTNSAVTADTTHQLYLIGATGSSGQQALKTDTGIYATTTPGQLHATTFDVNSKCTLQFNTTTNALDFVFA